MPRRRSSVRWNEPAPRPPRRPVNRCRALLVIDNAPLQSAAWAELGRARKRLEKATHDIHRHEETDMPAFRAWLARTFPTLLSAVRELAQQVDAKARVVQAVEDTSFFTGQAPSRVWRAWQENGGRPPDSPPPGHPAGQRGTAADDGFSAAGEDAPDLEEAFDEEMKRLFRDEGMEDDDPFAREFRGFAREMFGFDAASEPAPESADARDIYRRLVRHLHPDRGGEWTTSRARVWEQVQEAWATRDADWLARLEAEWEARTDILGPTSSVGRLRAALAEIEAARRDAEKRVRLYRKDDAWRFSLRPATDKLRQNLERKLRHDEAMLRRQLDELCHVLDRWERAAAKHRAKRRRPAVTRTELF